MMKHPSGTLAISACIVCTPLFAHAQTDQSQVAQPQTAQPRTPASSAWQFEFTPYLWAAGISGWSRIGANTPTVKFNFNFSDVWRNLDIGAMGSFEARNGRWAVLFDGVFVKLSKDSRPLLGGALGHANLKLDETIFQLAGAYRVLDTPVTPVDVLLGVRITDLYGEFSFSQSVLLPNGPSRSNSTSWADAFLGVRAAYAFSDKWSVIGYADAGTGGTKYSWQLYGGLNYNFSKTIVAKLGYRVLTQKYEPSGFLFNVKTSGVYAGVGIKF
ncbi:outer membrane protein [Burkholderia sp. S-53]|uniref:outer membrane protein n=1 Tax=Burkholderia sp. S-53 TaxID=2906514 RepID=UPI0021CFD3E9|nr:hypothetical protein [Burkholderia sp. S-53]UXU86121.1 hypothetical protein LXM88_02245 [Burkholderia sp. S-53]